MSKFAAYDDSSIYAIGNTPDEAIENARRHIGEPEAKFMALNVTDEFAAWIEENGWNGWKRSFAIRKGYLVDTTDE